MKRPGAQAPDRRMLTPSGHTPSRSRPAVSVGARLREPPVSSKRVERKLAAILAADVAGYSRLMGADEEDTLARLKAHRREVIDPKIAEHRGRVVRITGDGI